VATACEPSTGGCSATALPSGVICDDGSACTAGDGCVAGLCKGTQKTCQDGLVCTFDLCDPLTGCQNPAVAEPLPCDDGDVCTTESVCEAGDCVASKELTCDDGNPCTADFCAGGCQSTPQDGLLCDDGNACTETSKCVADSCDGFNPTDCDDGVACTADGCDPETGCTHDLVDAECDDENPCTQDFCAEDGCDAAPSGEGATCVSGASCTIGETCSAGECGGGTTCEAAGKFCNSGQCVGGGSAVVHFSSIGARLAGGGLQLTVSGTPTVGGDLKDQTSAQLGALTAWISM
jgi:hypothetical protein